MEMAHSVEGRLPFRDHHVVKCICRAPVSLKIRGRDREIFAPRSCQANDQRNRVSPAKASVSLAAGDDGSDGAVP